MLEFEWLETSNVLHIYVGVSMLAGLVYDTGFMILVYSLLRDTLLLIPVYLCGLGWVMSVFLCCFLCSHHRVFWPPRSHNLKRLVWGGDPIPKPYGIGKRGSLTCVWVLQTHSGQPKPETCHQMQESSQWLAGLEANGFIPKPNWLTEVWFHFLISKH